MKVTTLVENTAVPGPLPLTGEHGLSFLIQTGGNQILFDTGQGKVLLHNADLLKVDLAAVDTVVLSHGHFDHAGGLAPLMERNKRFTLMAHPDVFDDKQVGRNGQHHAIGVPAGKLLLEKFNIPVRLDAGPVDIAPGIMTTGQIPMETDYESIEPEFLIKAGSTFVKDTIKDDQGLILDTPKGSVVLLGCAHRGIINILNHVKKLTQNKKIHAIMGGLHLWNADAKKLERVLDDLAVFDMDKMIVGHCTGLDATTALVGRFGDKIVPNTVGSVFEF